MASLLNKVPGTKGTGISIKSSEINQNKIFFRNLVKSNFSSKNSAFLKYLVSFNGLFEGVDVENKGIWLFFSLWGRSTTIFLLSRFFTLG